MDVEIVSALAGLGVAHRNKIEKYRGNSSLVDNIAGWFGVGEGSIRVEAITLSWKGVWWHKAVESLVAPSIPQKTINDLTYGIW